MPLLGLQQESRPELASQRERQVRAVLEQLQAMEWPQLERPLPAELVPTLEPALPMAEVPEQQLVDLSPVLLVRLGRPRTRLLRSRRLW